MTKTLILKKPDAECPNCQKMGLFLKLAMGGKYDQYIRIVHRDEDTQEYQELVEKFGIMSMPAVIDIDSDTVISTGFDPGAVVDYFESL